MAVQRMSAGIQHRWDDLRFPATGQQIDTSSGRIDYDYTECTIDFATNARYTEEPLCIIAQMQHRKLLGSDVHPHIHWIQEEANFPNWLLAYRFYNNGATVPGAFTLATVSRNYFTWAAGSLLQLSEFPAISAPAGETVSAILDLILYRDSGNISTEFAGADPYTVAAKLKEFDVHYRIDGRGSRQEYVK